ncbi:MAG TPA: CapA family protein [Terriglobales bacterium]|nr:CapA family protein [Terriglobales bacterium]
MCAENNSSEIRLLFTGDIMLARQVQVELKHRHISPWSGFTQLFAGADWIGGNFEGAIGAQDQCLPGTQNLCFAAPLDSLNLLKSAGFKALSIENNHAGDLGKAGREQTLTQLIDAGVMPLDFEHSPLFLRFGNITVALVAVSTIAAADGEVQQIPSVELAQKLRLARRLANLVAVSIHWGTELQDWPSQAQRQQASWLVQHGADVIFGHHPHVVQQPECVLGKPVFFSLGNHVFDQKYPETKDGLIADCRISAGRLRCGGIATQTRPETAMPAVIGPEATADTALANCTPRLGEDFVVAGVTLRPEPWSPEKSLEGVTISGSKSGVVQWRFEPQNLLSLEAGQLAGTTSSALVFALERHHSPLDQEDGVRPYVYAIGRRGLVAKWRGSALAWPLLDAVVDPKNNRLCALHRSDSFMLPNPAATGTRVAAYKWNGFGFSGLDDPEETEICVHALE